MKTAIVADSNCCITPEEARELGIFILPMPVIVEDKTYFEGVDITFPEFVEVLAQRKEVSTSQPALGAVMELWDKLLEEYDEIVHIPMSSALSDSCRTAQGLAEEYRGKVWVVDNRRISGSFRSSVMDARQMALGGVSGEKIKAELEKTAMDAMIFVAVETLEYLKRSGRVTAAAATVSTLLNIKPVLKIEGEKLDAFAKVRGMNHCREKMLESMRPYVEEFKRKGWPIYLGAASRARDTEDGRAWAEEIAAAFPAEQVSYLPLGCSISGHVGEGAYGIYLSRCLPEGALSYGE